MMIKVKIKPVLILSLFVLLLSSCQSSYEKILRIVNHLETGFPIALSSLSQIQT